MTPLKLRVLLVTHSYGGNGGIKSEHPDVRDWLIDTVLRIKADPRCELIEYEPGKRVLDISDTPVTLCRNRAVVEARRLGADVLCCVDSDQAPDLEVGYEPIAKPFWVAAFDFLYQRYNRGPVVVGAPYCGPSPDQCVYVFRWRNKRNPTPAISDHQLEMYTREEAELMSGVQECAALPTGLIMYDMRIFDLLEPNNDGGQGWYAYEWTDKYASHKGSTEDVMATRNMSFIGEQALGYNPLHCAWDSWAGHWKPELVGKPRSIRADEVSRAYADAMRRLPRDRVLGRVESNVPDEYIAQNLYEEKPPTPDEAIRAAENQTTCTDLSVLQGLVKRLVDRFPERPLKIVEVGSFFGESALAMAEALGPKGGTIYCVDTWEGSASDKSSATYRQLCEVLGEDAIYKTFLHKTGHKNDVIAPVRGKSVEVAAKFEELSGCDTAVDLVFIDADHLYEAVKEDIRAWLPHLRAEGILCGHDFGLFPGVSQAVNELFSLYDLEGLVWSVDFGRSRQVPRYRASQLQEANGRR